MDKLLHHVIRNYILEINATTHLSRESIKLASYSKWGAEELLSDLMNNTNKPDIEVIDKFIERMDNYSCYDAATSFMFATAKYTGESIMDIYTERKRIK